MVRQRQPVSTVRTVAIMATCAMIFTGIAVDRVLFHMPPGDPTEYFKDVAARVEAWPTNFGDWVGEDEEIPEAAIELIDPNADLHRTFTNLKTREIASVLIVHCKDTRDMGGHYPPNCYPRNGWDLAKSEKRNYEIGELRIRCMEYHFRTGTLDRERSIHITNFLVHPDGTTERTVHRSHATTEDPRIRGFGAGQIQIVLGERIRPERRGEVVQEILVELAPVIKAMLSGIPQ